MIKFIIPLSLLFIPGLSYAEISDAADVRAIGSLLVNGGYLAGIILFIAGLYGLYQWGTRGASGGKTLSYALMSIFAGTCLLISLVLYDYVKASTIDPTWTGSGNPLAIDQAALDQGFAENGVLGRIAPKMQSSILGFLMLVGFFFYLKGIYLLKNIGGPPPSRGGGWPSKIAAHSIGGIILMNMQNVGCGFFSWMGFGFMCGT